MALIQRKFIAALIYATLTFIITYGWLKLVDHQEKFKMVYENKFASSLIYSALTLIITYFWLRYLDPDVILEVDQTGNVTKKITY